MCTNPVLVPVSLVSQFLANEKMASRHWLQCQMECLLDQVFDQLSTKFEDYLASNAITGTAHHTTIDTDPIQHQLRHELPFQAHSHPQFQATTDHLIKKEFSVDIEQSPNQFQMMNVNEPVNTNAIHSEMNQNNDKYSLDYQLSNRQQTDDIDDAAARVVSDEIDVKDEIDDSNDEIANSDQISHKALPVFASTWNKQSNLTNENDEKYDLDITQNDEQPNRYGYIEDDAQMNSDEVKEEIDDAYDELIITEHQEHLHSLSVTTLNLENSDQNDEHGKCGLVRDDDRTGNENIDDDADRADGDQMDVKEEIDEELFTIDQLQYSHSSSVLSSNLELSNQNDNEDGDDQPPNDDDDVSHVNSDEFEVKEEIDDTNDDIIIREQNSQTSQPVFASASNEQSSHNWTSENDEEYDLDGTGDDEEPNGLEHGDFYDDARMDSDDVEVKEEIDDTNNELTNELQQNPALLPGPTPKVYPSKENYNDNVITNDDGDDGDDGLDDQQQNEHLRDGNYETNKHNEKRYRLRKKPRLEATQPNMRQSPVTSQSMRLVNSNQTDQYEHINEQSNFDRRQSNEEANEEADEANEVNNQEKQIITISFQCRHTGCSLMFDNKTKLDTHMYTQHQILPHRCLVKNCGQSFSNPNNLSSHNKQVHPNTNQWNCDECPRHFHTHRILSIHNQQYHQLGQYKCAFSNCAFMGEQRRKMYDHYIKQHKPTVEFICQNSNCNRRFNDKANFKKHQRVHLGIKPYRCKWPACSFAAKDRSNTISHIKNKHLKKGSTETSQVDPRDYIEVIRDI